MPRTSTAPATLATLISLFRAAPGLASAAVRDGAVVTGSSARQAVIVGWYGTENDEIAVEGQDTPEGLAAAPDREQYSVRCAAMARSGTGDMAGARAAAFALRDICATAIYADHTLGKTVLRAAMGTWSLHPAADQRGATATVQFMIDVDAFTGR